jgi:hypothetical protein
MKTLILLVVLCSLLTACKTQHHQDASSKIETYSRSLEQFSAGSLSNLDTAKINAEYYKADIHSITEQEMKEISQEVDFKKVLGTEKILLTLWKPAENFKSYGGVPSDSLLRLARRCSTFDRAPSNANRVPVARGVRTVSLRYYKVEVPIAFHIIKNSRGGGEQGNMAARINAQVNLLNSAYNQFNISFKLVSTDVTINNVWFDRASYYTDTTALSQMTAALSKNPEKVMNVYTLGSQAVLGEATFPWYPENGGVRDYIVINYNTLPNGPITFFEGRYNEGKTLVHEVGHFLGLLHTFEGGNADCQSSLNDGCNIGDEVEDTPSQQLCYFDGCDENVDSCPALGKDPVKNYMGYNPDACMRDFSQGQGERLMQSIINFRYYLVTNPI